MFQYISIHLPVQTKSYTSSINNDSAIYDKSSSSSTNFGADKRSDGGAICDYTSNSSTDYCADDSANSSTIGADSSTIRDTSPNSSSNSGAN